MKTYKTDREIMLEAEEKLRLPAAPETPAASDPLSTENLTLSEAVAQCEKNLLKNTMQKVHSMKAASQVLGVDISTISRKLKQYGLSTK